MNEMCLKRNGVGLVWNGHSPKLALTPICPRETVFHNCDVIKDKRCRRILDIQNHTNCSRSSIPGCDAFSEKQLFELILMEKLRQKETLRITSFEPSPFDCQIRNHSSQTPTSPPKKKKTAFFQHTLSYHWDPIPPQKTKNTGPSSPKPPTDPGFPSSQLHLGPLGEFCLVMACNCRFMANSSASFRGLKAKMNHRKMTAVGFFGGKTGESPK